MKNTHAIRQQLRDDPSSGLEAFREEFLSHLDSRDFVACVEMLITLNSVPEPIKLRQAHQHYAAVLLSVLRRYDMAETQFRDLLRQRLTMKQRARTLMELAVQLDELGSWSEAEHFYQQALNLYRQTDNPLGVAKVYNNLGISICFQVEQGVADRRRLKEAIDFHKNAQQIARNEQHRREMAKNLHSLGKAYGLDGQYANARKAFDSYQQWCEETQNFYAKGYTLTDKAALIEMPQGRYGEAALLLDEAIPLLRDADDDLDLAIALMLRGKVHAHFDKRTAAEECFEEAIKCAESVRTRLTAPLAQIGYRTTIEAIYAAPLTYYLKAGHPDAALSIAERARARVLADMLLGRSSHSPTTENDSKRFHRKLSEEELMELARYGEALDRIGPANSGKEPLTARDIHSRLTSDGILLTYVIDDEDRLWVLVVTSEDICAERIGKITGKWLHNIILEHIDGSRKGRLVPDPATGKLATPHILRQLQRLLIEPVATHLDRAQTVYVVPTGPLHYAPLGALTTWPDEGDIHGKRTASTKRRIVHAPSATVLFDYSHRRRADHNHSILAIAPSDDRLRVHKGAALAIANRPVDASLVGDLATREALLQQAPEYGIICFLGHAFFNRSAPMSSYLKFADGVLDASGLTDQLRLNAELVVLAACSSGRSRVLRGDELFGLSRSLLYAGASSILATLWPVHETPTRLFMERFFENLFRGTGDADDFDPAYALAETQRWLCAAPASHLYSQIERWEEFSSKNAIDEQLDALWRMTANSAPLQPESRVFAHPHFWSPYILIGDRPRTALNRASG